MTGSGARVAPDDLVELGRVVSAYGVRGWVKVQPHSSQSEVLRAASVWWVAAPAAPAAQAGLTTSNPQAAAATFRRETLRPFDVIQSRRQGSTVVAELAGIGDRDIAEAMRSHLVLVSRKEFPPAKRGEYYWVDLIGCQVFGVDPDAPGKRVLIGLVGEVLDNGAHALLRVLRHQTGDDGAPTPVLDAKGRAVDTLIPFVKAHVPKVDIVGRRIDTDWPVDF